VKGSNRIFVLLGIIVLAAAAYHFLSVNRNQGLTLIGTVDANQVIVSSKIAGRIEKLLVQEGTPVKQGDLIAVLDTAELEAQKRAAEATLVSLRSQVSASRANESVTLGSTASDVQSAQAKVQATHAQLQQAEADLERQTLDTNRTVALAEQGVASQQDRDRAASALKAQEALVQSLTNQVRAAQGELSAAQARLHQQRAAQSTVASTQAQMLNAQAQLAEAETRLGYTQILAPVSGTVSVRAAREGEVVNPGTPIVTIVDLSDSWVWAAIPETYQDKIVLGDKLDIRMPSGTIISGKVIFKDTEGDYATQRDVSRRKRDIKTVALKLRIENANMQYATGTTAEVLVPPGKLRASTVAQRKGEEVK
jgi:multidrug resistance efflux pump